MMRVFVGVYKSLPTDLCNGCCEIWAGCPAVESLDDGVENSSIKSNSAAVNDFPDIIQRATFNFCSDSILFEH